jgi:hypothetical protein
MISWTFQSIFTRTKLDFNIRIIFEFNNKVRQIKCKNNCIQLNIDGTQYYNFKLGSKLTAEKSKIHKDMVCNFWNGKILLSTFETSGEYPNKKPTNYIGYDPIIKYDLAQLYGRNSYGYPSITKGILRLLKSKNKQRIAEDFFKQM